MKFSRKWLFVVLVVAVSMLALAGIIQAQAAINVGDTVEGRLSAREPRVSYTLTLDSSQDVVITLTSTAFDPYLVIEDSDGLIVAEDDDSAGSLNSRISATLPAGTYTVIATSFREHTSNGDFFETGAYTLTITGSGGGVQPTPAPTQMPTTDGINAINSGDSVASSLDATTPRAFYVFTLNSVADVDITLVSNDFDAYLLLYDAQGNIVTQDDDSGGRLNSRIQISLQPGEYTIAATSLRYVNTNGQLFASGSYTLSFDAFTSGAQPTPPPPMGTPTPLPPPPMGTPTPPPPMPTPTPAVPTPVPTQTGGRTEIAIGESVQGQLTTSQPTQEFIFEAQAGDLITINMTASFDTYLILLDSNRSEVTRDDDGGDGLNSRIGPYEISAAGRYIIVANSYGNIVGGTPGTGVFNLSVAAAAVDQIEYTQTVSGTISGSAPVYVYRFSGQAGDIVTVNLTTGSTAVYMTMTGGNGRTNLGTYGGTGIIGPYTLPQTGGYIINVTSYDTFSSTPFTLALNRIQPEPIEFGAEIETSFGDEAARFYSFEAVQGDAINVTVTSGGSVDTRIVIIDPFGTEIASDDDGGQGFDPEIRNLILQQTGTYSLLVSPYIAGDDGTFTVRLDNDGIASLDEELEAVLRISNKQYAASVVFAGVAGEVVRLNVDVLTVTAEPRITVTQGGATLASNAIGNVRRLSIEFVVPNEGTVQVSVQDFSGNPAIVQISLERLEGE